MNQKLNQYKRNSITTAKPGKILLMLYNGAIVNVRKAKDAMEKKNIPDKCKYILKVQDIIHELANTLDASKGGKELTENLSGLYDYMSFELTEAHINNTIKPLENVEKVLVTLNEGWVEAVKQIEG